MTSSNTLGPTFSPDPQGDGQSSSAQWRRHMVMVVDDSMAVRKVVEASFTRAGMDAVSFPSGIAAINALATGAVPVPDVVLLDIGMPKMDGYEVARILRANPHFADTPIIMLSGRDGVVDRVRSRFAGARDFIAKPFRSTELVQRVCSHLRIAVSTGDLH